jgi:putative polyhydroxyalkanoate system protein
MPDLTATIPHQLTREQARQRLQDRIAAFRRQPGFAFADVAETWSGDRMDFTVQAAGQRIAGFLIVDDRAVHVTVTLPWLLSVLAGSIRKGIERDVHHILSPANPQQP